MREEKREREAQRTKQDNRAIAYVNKEVKFASENLRPRLEHELLIYFFYIISRSIQSRSRHEK